MDIFSYMSKKFLPLYISAKIIKIDRDFLKLWSQMYCHLFLWFTVYKYVTAIPTFPLYFWLLWPIIDAWYRRPYFGVSCLVFIARNNAFSAPSICTVDAGCLAKFNNDPVKQYTQVSHLSQTNNTILIMWQKSISTA